MATRADLQPSLPPAESMKRFTSCVCCFDGSCGSLCWADRTRQEVHARFTPDLVFDRLCIGIVGGIWKIVRTLKQGWNSPRVSVVYLKLDGGPGWAEPSRQSRRGGWQAASAPSYFHVASYNAMFFLTTQHQNANFCDFINSAVAQGCWIGKSPRDIASFAWEQDQQSKMQACGGWTEQAANTITPQSPTCGHAVWFCVCKEKKKKVNSHSLFLPWSLKCVLAQEAHWPPVPTECDAWLEWSIWPHSSPLTAL